MTNIPRLDHWDIVPLSELCEFQNGYAFKNKDFQESAENAYVVFKMGNIKRGGGLKHDAKCSFIAREKCASLKRFVLNEGDLTMSMTDMKASMALLGHTARVDQDDKYILNQRVGRITVKDTARLDDRFLYYYTNIPAYISYLHGVAHSGVQVNLSTAAIKESPIVLPEIETQRKIAAILSLYDDLIENNTKRLKILEEIARTLYREWFVKFRFPGHENAHFVDSQLGRIPKGWEVMSLDESLDILETGNRPKGGVSEIRGGVPSIGAENVKAIGQYDFLKTKYIPREYFEHMKSGHLSDRDVLVYKDGGKPGYFRPHVSMVGEGFPFAEMAINSHVYRLRAKQRIGQAFLYFYLSSDEMMHWMHLHGTGAAIPGIARRDLMKLPLLLPEMNVASTFSEFAEDIVTLILVTARKSQILHRTRDLLLSKLISGKLDVSELDIEMGGKNI